MIASARDGHRSNAEASPTDKTTNLEMSENALRVLRARYLKKNEAGQIVETPADLFRRVARTMADIETRYGASEPVRQNWEDRFYDLMVSGRYMPNSPTLMNAGREMGMLSACFVLPVKDSINEIFDSIKHTALIQKAGGGTGFAFDELRPTGDYIKSSGGTTSGPISFWRAFSEATNAIQQGAFRRGANMGMMYIHHPDILKFLNAKQDLSQFTNYNISVKITDEWMERFLEDADAPHILRNPRNGKEYIAPRDLDIWGYDLRSLTPVRRGQNGELRVICQEGDSETEKVISRGSPFETPVYTCRDIWKIIVENAHRTGEPGVVFIDRVNEHNPTPHIGRMEATNPCGEQPLLPYEACNLGSVNLSKFVVNPNSAEADIDWDALRETVYQSTRFLDNVIDANNYQLEQIDRMCKGNRKIGLGIMGFAETLYMLGVSYCSEEGIAWGEKLMGFINEEAHNASERLAQERGCFPNWPGSTWDTKHHRPMRNACATTVAPTGTISIIAGCSGGVEPMFSLVFFRNVLKGQDEGKSPMIQIDPTFEQVARDRGFYSEGMMEQIARDGTLAAIDGIPEDVRHVFVCAHDVNPEWHVKMQAAFQRHCDSSISKTINFAHEATVEDVETIYRLAYEMKCKGVTVYRDGCRSAQPMALKDSDRKHASNQTEAPAQDDKRRTRIPSVDRPLEPQDIPEIVSGLRLRQMTPFGNMHVKITVDPRSERELEVFAQLGKGGDIATSDLEAICRMISLWLRAGGTLKHVIRQLKDIGSSLQVPTRDGKIMSLGDGLARALQRYMRAKERFGLHDLLLGECDLSELDRPLTGSPMATGPGGGPPPAPRKPGNGKANGNGGNGRRNGNGHNTPEASSEVRHATAASGFAGPATAAVATSPTQMARLAFKVKCPSCGEALVFAEGCNKCYNCGWAQC